MKVSSTAAQESPQMTTQQQITLPSGLIGFPNFTRAELIYQADQLPFMWLNSANSEELSFLVTEPAGLVKDYDIEISDADIAALDLKIPTEAMVLNIATVRRAATTQITVNLMGPIVINKRTLVGRQVIIGNAQKFSAKHLLVETSEG